MMYPYLDWADLAWWIDSPHWFEGDHNQQCLFVCPERMMIIIRFVTFKEAYRVAKDRRQAMLAASA